MVLPLSVPGLNGVFFPAWIFPFWYLNFSLVCPAPFSPVFDSALLRWDTGEILLLKPLSPLPSLCYFRVPLVLTRLYRRCLIPLSQTVY